MRIAPLALLVATLALGACSNPNLQPGNLFSGGPERAQENQRRGAVEIAVKTNGAAILNDLRAGGGPALTAAMETAAIPPRDREARTIQMRRDIALYESSQSALIARLVAYGG